MTRRAINQYDFRTQKFDELLLPTSGSGRRSTYPRGGTIKHIDIHHMTIKNTTDGGACRACVSTWKTRQASAHYGVDNTYVAQFVFDDRMAWGNANGQANREGIIVEHANSSLKPDYKISDATLATSAKLVAGLHLTHKLGRPTSSGFGTGGTIRTHQSFYSTACPGPYFKKIWSTYVKSVQVEYDKMKSVSTPTEPNPPVEEPIPIGPAPTDTHMVFGYGNAFLPYVLKEEHKRQIDGQLDLIKKMGVSMFVALELHEENENPNDGKLGALEYLKSQLAKRFPGWKVSEGEGGNHLLFDSKKYNIISATDKLLGKVQARWATKWNVLRIDSNMKFWVVGYHTPAGTTDDRVKARSDQFKQLVEWTKTLSRVIYALDKNNYTVSPGTPSQILKAAGRKSVWTTSVKNSHLDSHRPDKGDADSGKHIDDVQVGSLVGFSPGAELVETGELSDHRWLKVPLTIKA